MPTRIAAIDIGTNSTKMTVAEAGPGGRPVTVFERSEVTRLGKGVDATGVLQEDAVARTLDAVVRFAEEARASGVRVILAAGTSALRDAKNGPEVVAAFRDRAGVEVEIIAGRREAALAYAAVSFDESLCIDASQIVVFDIGGGSTELIFGGPTGVERSSSLDIGAVRLTERFIKTDPPSAVELAAVDRYALDALQSFALPHSRVAVAGIGGTAVNIAGVASGGAKNLHGSVVTVETVAAVLDRLRGCLLEERRTIPGLEPARADVVVAGAAILKQLLVYFDAPRFVVSTRGLRYGLIADHLAQGGGE